MKTETFKFSRKATTALLLCTGLVASQPLSLWAENDSGAVQIVQQQKITVKGTVNDAMGPVIGAHVGPGSVSCGWVSVKTRKELTGF